MSEVPLHGSKGGSAAREANARTWRGHTPRKAGWEREEEPPSGEGVAEMLESGVMRIGVSREVWGF